MNALTGSDIVTLKGFERADLELVFQVAEEMEPIARARRRSDLLADKILGTLFYQVSTRTRLSFESAMQRLGGGVLGFADPKTVRAGDYFQESLHDTVRVVESYADVLVIRHPRAGAPAEAARHAGVPVINGGDGYNEHPTQALLDLYTMRREKGSLDGLTVALVGDMNMRVMHSLPLALARYETKVFFVSPSDRTMPADWKVELDRVALDYEERTTLDDVLPETDVVYIVETITPSFEVGRVEQTTEKESTPSTYVFDRKKLAMAKPGVLVLHPLPRTDELPGEIDPTGAAGYFAQAFYGVPVRMALLALVLGRAPSMERRS
jgi:aspartate carbamoyltransferase catalytic subunit